MKEEILLTILIKSRDKVGQILLTAEQKAVILDIIYQITNGDITVIEEKSLTMEEKRPA